MPANIRLFIWFRVLFNCRFYYPVFTVLFLDLGLSIGEFAALNVIWAVTNAALEVPSGALADQFGRRTLVVTAGWLMVAEMLTLCLMPVGNHDAVLWLFVANRILSGAAEACASGADEALAFDSLPEADRKTLWSQAMAHLSRAVAAGFIVSSILGSFLYDHQKVSMVLGWFGAQPLPRNLDMKIPLVMNFAMAIACLIVTLRMREVPDSGAAQGRGGSIRANMAEAFRGILATGRWVWHSHAVLSLIVIGVVFDSIIRLFMTVASNFYRMIGIEEAWFGLIATIASLLGLLTAGLMAWLSHRFTAGKNFAWLAVVTFFGLLCAAYPFHGWWGVAMIMPLMLAGRFLQFFLSYYMNVSVDSTHRATVLSFRGVTINIAYGATTLLFGLHTHWLEKRLGVSAEDTRVFSASLHWWPWWFLGTLLVTAGWLRLRKRSASGLLQLK
jgi:MFS family permease